MSRHSPLSVEALKRDQYARSDNLMDRVNVHVRFGTNPRGFGRWVFETMRLRSGERVLDLGCGPGRLWSENADPLPDDVALCLVDFSVGMLAEARVALRGCQAAPPVEFAVADARSIPFEAGVFDIVVANHMLYHVTDRPRALAEIARALAPAGRLVASTPGATNMAKLGELLAEAGVDGAYWGGKTSAAFTLENGRAQLENDFEEIRVERYRDSLHVTEAEPLVRFARSLPRSEAMTDVEASNFRDLLEHRIDRDGAIDIPKSVGVFLARPRR